MSKKGLMHLYCGDGKGKTTAAIGLAVRAAGCGMSVLVVQFLKGAPTGELESLAKLARVTIVRGKASEKFTTQMDVRELQQTYDLNCKNLLTAMEMVRTDGCEMLILDEICGALAAELIDEDLLKNLINHCKGSVELVLTGRNPPEWLWEQADYITEMCARRHPYEKGISARRGIEM